MTPTFCQTLIGANDRALSRARGLEIVFRSSQEEELLVLYVDAQDRYQYAERTGSTWEERVGALRRCLSLINAAGLSPKD